MILKGAQKWLRGQKPGDTEIVDKMLGLQEFIPLSSSPRHLVSGLRCFLPDFFSFPPSRSLPLGTVAEQHSLFRVAQGSEASPKSS